MGDSYGRYGSSLHSLLHGFWSRWNLPDSRTLPLGQSPFFFSETGLLSSDGNYFFSTPVSGCLPLFFHPDEQNMNLKVVSSSESDNETFHFKAIFFLIWVYLNCHSRGWLVQGHTFWEFNVLTIGCLAIHPPTIEPISGKNCVILFLFRCDPWHSGWKSDKWWNVSFHKLFLISPLLIVWSFFRFRFCDLNLIFEGSPQIFQGTMNHPDEALAWQKTSSVDRFRSGKAQFWSIPMICFFSVQIRSFKFVQSFDLDWRSYFDLVNKCGVLYYPIIGGTNWKRTVFFVLYESSSFPDLKKSASICLLNGSRWHLFSLLFWKQNRAKNCRILFQLFLLFLTIVLIRH